MCREVSQNISLFDYKKKILRAYRKLLRKDFNLQLNSQKRTCFTTVLLY